MYQQRRPRRPPPPQRPRRATRRRRRGFGSCLWNTVVLGVLVVLLFEVYIHMARPAISSFLGEQVAVRLGLPADAPTTDQPGAFEEQIVGQAQQSLPTAIAALPSGELRVTDAQANAYLAANMEALDPVEGVQVQFVPGQVQADVRVFGTVSQVRAGLAVQDGRATLIDPQIEGPLGAFVSIEEIVRPLERQINSLLLNKGQRLESGRIEQGEVVVYIEQG